MGFEQRGALARHTLTRPQPTSHWSQVSPTTPAISREMSCACATVVLQQSRLHHHHTYKRMDECSYIPMTLMHNTYIYIYIHVYFLTNSRISNIRENNLIAIIYVSRDCSKLHYHCAERRISHILNYADVPLLILWPSQGNTVNTHTYIYIVR